MKTIKKALSLIKSKTIQFTEKYVFSLISKKFLLLNFKFFKLFVKILVVINILTAIIIYLANILKIEHQLTWDLGFILILGFFLI